MSENFKKVVEMLSESIFEKHRRKTIIQYMKDETWTAICDLSDHQERGSDISKVRLKHILDDCKWYPNLCEIVACIMLGKKIIFVISEGINPTFGKYAKEGALVIMEKLQVNCDQDAIVIINQSHLNDVSLNRHRIAHDIEYFETYCVD